MNTKKQSQKSMCRFIESICLREGTFRNLELHQERVQRALDSINVQEKIHLETFLQQQKIPTSGWWKCRVLYSKNIETISFEKYEPRNVSSLKIVEADKLDYSHKYEDRAQLENLFALRETCDDIIILKNGYVTDSLYANLAFKKNERWYTSENYLLPGIMREKLLKDQIVNTTEITLSNIHTFEKVKLINALLGFDGPEVEIKNIVF